MHSLLIHRIVCSWKYFGNILVNIEIETIIEKCLRSAFAQTGKLRAVGNLNKYSKLYTLYQLTSTQPTLPTLAYLVFKENTEQRKILEKKRGRSGAEIGFLCAVEKCN